MDGSRFDRLTRDWARGSRRTVVRGMAATAIAAAIGAATFDAEAKLKKNKCAPTNHKCDLDRPDKCCTKTCSDRGQGPRCVCAARGEGCLSDENCCLGSCDLSGGTPGVCCNGMICDPDSASVLGGEPTCCIPHGGACFPDILGPRSGCCKGQRCAHVREHGKSGFRCLTCLAIGKGRCFGDDDCCAGRCNESTGTCECVSDDDCPGDKQCSAGACVKPSGGGCQSDGDCTGGNVCQHGKCVACPSGKTGCEGQCLDLSVCPQDEQHVTCNNSPGCICTRLADNNNTRFCAVSTTCDEHCGPGNSCPSSSACVMTCCDGPGNAGLRCLPSCA